MYERRGNLPIIVLDLYVVARALYLYAFKQPSIVHMHEYMSQINAKGKTHTESYRFVCEFRETVATISAGITSTTVVSCSCICFFHSFSNVVVQCILHAVTVETDCMEENIMTMRRGVAACVNSTLNATMEHAGVW